MGTQLRQELAWSEPSQTVGNEKKKKSQFHGKLIFIIRAATDLIWKTSDGGKRDGGGGRVHLKTSSTNPKRDTIFFVGKDDAQEAKREQGRASVEVSKRDSAVQRRARAEGGRKTRDEGGGSWSERAIYMEWRRRKNSSVWFVCRWRTGSRARKKSSVTLTTKKH